jgi:methionine-rich copper-binding protein CopC
VDTLRNVEKLSFTDQTLDVATRPSAPVIGTAVAGNTSATVNWTPGPANGAGPLNQFQVQVLVGGNVVRTVTGIPPNSTSTVVNGLTNGTTYTFRVLAVNLAGTSDPSAASNAVTPGATAPQVTSTTPANGATSFAVGANLSATFSEPVSSPNWTAAVTLRNNTTGNLVGRAVTYNNATRTVTVNPNANLTAGTGYTMTLLGTGVNGIRNAAGVRLTTTTVTFTAGGTTTGDTTPPVVTSSTPANNATGVARGANTIVNFSERVVGLTATNVVLRNTATNNVVGAVLTVNAAGTQLTVNPNNNLAANTVFQLRLVGGPSAIRDAAGNPLATTTISFRTGA